MLIKNECSVIFVFFILLPFTQLILMDVTTLQYP